MLTDIPIGAEIVGSITGPVNSEIVAYGSPPLRRSCVGQALSRGDGPAIHYKLRRSTASIMRIRFDFVLKSTFFEIEFLKLYFLILS